MCDCLCALGAASGSGATVFAKNSDRPPGEAQEVEWFPPRRDDGPIATTHVRVAPVRETIGFVGSRPAWAWGVEHGVNTAGVAIGNEAIFTTRDPRRAPPGLIGIDLVRLGLERATTAAGAVAIITELLEKHGQGGSGHSASFRPYWSSFLVADADAAYVVETSDREHAVEPVRRTRAISNRTTIPAFDSAHRHPHQPVGQLVDPRLRASATVLANGPVTVSALQDHLRAHVGGRNGWTVCMHVDDEEATTAALVTELDPADSYPRAWFLLGAPCASVFVPVFVGRPFGAPPPWHAFAGLPTHGGRLDEVDALEAELAADAVDDPGWNAHAWRRVTDVLARLEV